MKKAQLLLLILSITFWFTACKKEGGDTIINNYGTSDNPAPARKLLKEYGLKDSTQVIKFTYQNNDPGKLKTLTTYSSSVANAKMLILYDASDRQEAYQIYTLPANTLNEQGTFKLDSKGRLLEVIKRKPNGDTIGIINAYYLNSDYQPNAINYYDKTEDQITHYDYINYDNNGNGYRMVSYTKNGTDPIYKSSEVEASGFGKGINPLTQLYYYVLISQAAYGFGNSGPLYFSNYFPNSSREQLLNPNGTSSGVSLSNFNYEVDGNNNVIGLSLGTQEIYMKY